MKKVFFLFLFTFLLLTLATSLTSAQGTYKCSADTLNCDISGCDKDRGYSGECRFDQFSGTCTSPLTPTTCIQTGQPPQASCGAEGQTCCATGQQCASNLSCSVATNICVKPGGEENDQCSAINPCGQGFTCRQGTCERVSTGNNAGGGSKGLTPSMETCGLRTAIGCVPVEDPNDFAKFVLRWGVGVGGGVALT